MIKSQITMGATVLTLMLVPFHHISSGEYNPMVRNSYIRSKPNHGWINIGLINCTDLSARLVMQQFRLLQKQQLHGPLHRADTEGLVVLIQDKYVAIHRRFWLKYGSYKV